MTRPLRSPPITGGSALLRAGPPAHAASVLNASRFPPLGALPLTDPHACRCGSIDIRLPTFHAEAADRARAAFTPGTTWPIDRAGPAVDVRAGRGTRRGRQPCRRRAG